MTPAQIGAVPTSAGGSQVDVFLYLGTRTITQINALSPGIREAVVAADTGTPSAPGSSALTPQDLAEWNGSKWVKIVSAVEGFLPAGTRALVAPTGLTLFAPLTDVTDNAKIATWDGASTTPTLETPTAGMTVTVRSGAASQVPLSYDATNNRWAPPFAAGLLGNNLELSVVYLLQLPSSLVGQLDTTWTAPAGDSVGAALEAIQDVAGALGSSASVSAFETSNSGHASDDADAEYVSHRFKTPIKNSSVAEFIAALFEDGHEITLDFAACASGNNLWVFPPNVAEAMKWEDDNDVQLLLLKTTTGDIVWALTGSLGLGTSTEFGSGKGVIGVQNAATVPSTNPTGGGVMYSEGGALKWRGSSGTVTVIAPA